MDPTRRKILKTGAAATVVAAAPGVFAQQASSSGTGKFYVRGPVRIHYEESGSGFPLMLIAGGGLNSTIAGLRILSTRSASSRASTAASRPTCATPTAASRPARSRSTAPGTRLPTTTSA